jgi:hypothetical protein
MTRVDPGTVFPIRFFTIPENASSKKRNDGPSAVATCIDVPE